MPDSRVLTKRLPFHEQLSYERELRGWSQADLAERLRCDTKTIGRWESGSSVPRPYHRQSLSELFGKSVEELGLIEDNDWFDLPQVSPLSHFDDLRAEISTISSAHHNQLLDPASPISFPPHIPDEPYFPLAEREVQLRWLLSALRDPLGLPAIVIDGLGGLGKTAFVVELARRALQHQLFEKALGDSAKLDQFTSDGIVRINEATLNFPALLDTIARQLDHWEIASLRAEEKHVKIAQLLRQHRYLLIVDNLESTDNAQQLVAVLRGFLGSSRALITSRQKVRHDFVLPLSLHGLDQQDALCFIQQDLQKRGGDQLSQVPREKLAEICRITGGAPLAIKLVVAQAMFLDIDVVLQQLEEANGNIYSFIFRKSWEQLSLLAQLILIFIGRSAATTISWEELAETGIARQELELRTAVRQLVDHSLLDVYTVGGQVRYSIHQLTRQFFNGNLPRLWKTRME